MKKDLKVTIVQTALAWEDIDANLAAFSEKLGIIGQSASDLIVLPEMFNTGFTMNASHVAEPMNGKTMQWMAKFAAKKNCVVTGSLVIKDADNYYNRLIWMRPDGTSEFYNKRHTFRMAEENKTYASGDKKLIVELEGWRVCPLVCYDLRFPVWSRNTPQAPKGALNSMDYDLLVYVANWPDRRIHAWRSLLVARAIENQAYVIGVNRVGKDGKDIEYTGYSIALTPKGEPMSSFEPNKESIETINLPYKDLESYREEFPVGLDADKFAL
ncbi:MAG TPA: amidohydrolase [Bacteroidia bacterium]|jgi:omega-amidase|nr:amidohydrolase [Bacteroidia bacterium]